MGINYPRLSPVALKWLTSVHSALPIDVRQRLVNFLMSSVLIRDSRLEMNVREMNEWQSKSMQVVNLAIKVETALCVSCASFPTSIKMISRRITMEAANTQKSALKAIANVNCSR